MQKLEFFGGKQEKIPENVANGIAMQKKGVIGKIQMRKHFVQLLEIKVVLAYNMGKCSRDTCWEEETG